MKKYLALLLALTLVLALAGCNENPATQPTQPTTQPTQPTTPPTQPTTPPTQPDEKGDGVMSYDAYMAAPMDAEVTIEAYVQAHQSWWDNKITVYAQDADGAYFIYNMACAEEDAAKLVPGTKIRVTGYKGSWAGEIEIMDATFEIIEGNWIASPMDATSLLGTEELIEHQNKFVSFKALTIANISYKNGEPGDDIYVDVALNGNTYSFCVERYLTGLETDVYKAFAELKAGDVVDMEGFLYWYEGVNTHITSVAKSVDEKGDGVMSYDEYMAAPMDAEVTIEAYVQAHQSWWDNKITVYAQDYDGAYFLYNMACSEENAAKLVPGTKIRVTGYKGSWAGEIEIMDATFEIIEGNWIASPMDATSLLGTDELIKHQNKFVSFKGLTIENISYKNGEPGDDIYVDVSLNGNTYSFCVERYLTGPETDVYKAFAELKVGDKVDMEGFLYWYEGVNTHITSVKAAG